MMKMCPAIEMLTYADAYKLANTMASNADSYDDALKITADFMTSYSPAAVDKHVVSAGPNAIALGDHHSEPSIREA